MLRSPAAATLTPAKRAAQDLAPDSARRARVDADTPNAAKGKGPALLNRPTGPSGCGKTQGVQAMYPNALAWMPQYGAEKQWWGHQRKPDIGTACFIDEPVNNTDPNKLIPRLPFPIAKETFGGGPCQLETKHEGIYVSFMCTTLITACTRPIEDWYTLPNGDVQPEWLRRLQDFCTVYEVQPGDFQADRTLTTVGKPFREVWPQRLAERSKRLAAFLAQGTQSDSGGSGES